MRNIAIVKLLLFLAFCSAAKSKESPGQTLWFFQKHGQSFGIRMGHIIRDDAGILYVISKPKSLVRASPRYQKPVLSGLNPDHFVIAIWNNNNEFVSAAPLQVSPDLRLYDIAVDIHGRVYLYGSCEDNSWVLINGTRRVLKKRGENDGILIRCTTDGVVSAFWQFGGKGHVYARSIVAMPDGSICATGTFDEELYLDDHRNALRSNGVYDVFIANIRPDGSQGWLTQFGGPKFDGIDKIAADETGFLYLTGSTSCSGEVPKLYREQSVFYLAKLDPNGQPVWIQKTPSYWGSGAWNVQMDRFKNVFVTGTFRDEISFKFGGKLLSLLGTEGLNYFIASFSNDGQFQKAIRLGGRDFLPSISDSWAVVYDESWNMYLVPKEIKQAVQSAIYANPTSLNSSYGSAVSQRQSPALFLAASPMPNGDMEITLDGQTDGIYVIESSTEFAQWQPVSTNVVTAGRIILQDAFKPSLPKRFFRIKRRE